MDLPVPEPTELAEDLLGPILPLPVAETRAVYVTTINGSASVIGRSHDLGDAADSAILMRLREWSDLIIVGAGTVRTENYGPSIVSPSAQQRRRIQARRHNPVMAIVSASLNLDPHAKVFSNPHHLPLIFHPPTANSETAERRHALERRGIQVVDIRSSSARDIVAAAHSLGFPRIVCEGGPSLYARFFAERLLDVVHLTLDPRAVIGGGMPFFAEPKSTAEDGESTVHFRLETLRRSDGGYVFARYRRT